jgi:hypothetical protein
MIGSGPKKPQKKQYTQKLPEERRVRGQWRKFSYNSVTHPKTASIMEMEVMPKTKKRTEYGAKENER